MIWHANYTVEMLNASRTTNLGTLMGIEITEVGDNFLKGRMPVDERTRQPFGILHGGASCVLSETLGSVAAWMCINPETHASAGLEINANHIRSIREGAVIGMCRPMHTGRKTHVWQTEITEETTGKLVCISRLTVAILEREDFKGDKFCSAGNE